MLKLHHWYPKNCQYWPHSRFLAIASSLLVGAFVGFAPHAIANSNFGRVTIASSGAQDISGHTGGSVPLSSIEPGRQQNGPCTGHAESNPDHILVFAGGSGRDTINLSITVDSTNGGRTPQGDTTLLIKRPDGKIYCNDDGNGSDAQIQQSGWPAGEYHVWVGAFEPGVEYEYTLTVER